MKKIFSFILLLLLVLEMVACGNKTPFEIAESKLDESEMSKDEYSISEIANFESRFAKMELSGGFSKVYHYRSKTDYAYLIVFENEGDAKTFYEKIGTAKYNVVMSKDVVVYGESDWIDKIKFE